MDWLTLKLQSTQKTHTVETKLRFNLDLRDIKRRPTLSLSKKFQRLSQMTLYMSLILQLPSRINSLDFIASKSVLALLMNQGLKLLHD